MAAAGAAAHAAGSVPSVIFVCLGNICRSCTAEAVMKARAERAGLRVEVASAGTGGWHVGDGAHPPMVRAASRKGYDMRGHRAQQISKEHMEQYDMVIAMDSSNMRDLRSRFASDPAALAKLSMFPSYHPDIKHLDGVPDPYYEDNYEEVVGIVEKGCDGLIETLQARAK